MNLVFLKIIKILLKWLNKKIICNSENKININVGKLFVKN